MSRPETGLPANATAGMAHDGDGAPIFAEPWQAQAFALTIELHGAGHFSWTEWVDALGAAIAVAGPGDDGRQYWDHWLVALEGLVAAKGLSGPDETATRKQQWAEAYATTPHGQPVELAGAKDRL